MPESTSPSPTNPFKKMKLAANRALIVAIIAILLAALLGLLAANTWTHLQHLKTETRLRAESIRKNTHETLTQLQSEQQRLTTQVNQLHNQLNLLSSTSLLNQQAFSEASYLVHMANLHLIISHDTDTAVKLLQLAKQQLSRVASASALQIKQAVAMDISRLKQSQRLDMAKLLAQLNQLNTTIQQLPDFPTHPLTPTPTKDATPSWRQQLGHTLQGLKQLVIIRRHQQPIKPLLASEQLLFLKQNIQLKMAEAEWAVLHHNKAVYQQSLKTVKQWLTDEYSDQAAAADALGTLQSLLTIDVNPTLPDLTHTLSTFNAIPIQPHAKEAP